MRIVILKEGYRIHLKNKNGMYTVIGTHPNGLWISCKAWIARADYPQNNIPKQWISYSDVKCLAGGMNRPEDVEFNYIQYLETKGKLTM